MPADWRQKSNRICWQKSSRIYAIIKYLQNCR